MVFPLETNRHSHGIFMDNLETETGTTLVLIKSPTTLKFVSGGQVQSTCFVILS